MPVVRDTFHAFRDNAPPGFSIGQAGANRVWDFSSLAPDATETTYAIAPASTPYSSDFPNANFALTNDFSGFIFFKNTSTALKTEGFAVNDPSLGVIAVNYSPIPDQHRFPATYTANFAGSYGFIKAKNYNELPPDVQQQISAGVASCPNATANVQQVRVTYFSEYTDTIDAWGKVITPLGTYDGLRRKRLEHTRNTIEVYTNCILPFIYSWIAISDEFDTTNRHTWLNPITKLPVVSPGYDGQGNITSVTYSAIPPPPVAAFSWEALPGGTVNFTSNSENSPETYEWDFGDGRFSDLQNPAHVYEAGGTYWVCMTVTNISSSDILCDSVTVFGATCTEQVVSLASGWNIISSYIVPDNIGMEAVFSDIAANIAIVKNSQGATYIPAFSINDIGDWDITQGYKVKTNSAVMLTLGCIPANPATPISLSGGWNMVAYLRPDSMPIETALASLGAGVLIVKNNDGKTYIPAFSINNIGNVQPGQGYQIKMLTGGTLIYPEARLSGETFFTQVSYPTHFSVPLNTGSNATIIFPQGVLDESFSEGDEIAVISAEGNIAGVAVVQNGAFALTVWGDDASTQNIIEGMTDDEAFSFVYWSNEVGVEQPLHLTFSEGSSHFSANSISIAEYGMTNVSSFPYLTSRVYHLHAYPNPSTGRLFIEIILPENSKIDISILDIKGRTVLSLPAMDLEAGSQVIGLDMTGLAQGQYILEAVGNEGVGRERIVYVK